MSFGEYISQQVGSTNWVVARRTSRVLRKYGEDVVTISQKRYRTLLDEWHNQNLAERVA